MLTDLFIYFHSVFPVSFRSFVPPVRDEESETQRKAHAKRVRETRRSTQGVTLEEVKSAEQLAKKKQAETVSSFTLSPSFASSLKMMTLLIDGILLLCFGFCLSLSLSLSLSLWVLNSRRHLRLMWTLPNCLRHHSSHPIRQNRNWNGGHPGGYASTITIRTRFL